MRFADAPTARMAMRIEAAPVVVWAFVTDLDVLARFSDEFQGGVWLDTPVGAGPGVGARFRGRNKNSAAAWEVTCTVTDWEPGRAFGWIVGDPEAPAAAWRFTLDAEDGGTRLDYWARMGPGPSGVTSFIDAHPEDEERIVTGRLAAWTANMASTLDGVRGLAEGRPDPD